MRSVRIHSVALTSERVLHEHNERAVTRDVYDTGNKMLDMTSQSLITDQSGDLDFHARAIQYSALSQTLSVLIYLRPHGESLGSSLITSASYILISCTSLISNSVVNSTLDSVGSAAICMFRIIRGVCLFDKSYCGTCCI